MPFNGSGVYAAPASSWNPAVANTDIDTTDWAALLADLATALSLCVTKDGQQTTTALVPFAANLSTASYLRFPATQSASGGANDFDDYEEGTFTPTLLSGGNQVGRTYTTQFGRYTKIGNVVNFWALITLSAVGSSTGDTNFAALPFTSANVGAGMFYAVKVVADDLAAGVTTAVEGYVSNNAATGAIAAYAAGQLTTLQETGLTATSTFIISGSYPTA